MAVGSESNMLILLDLVCAPGILIYSYEITKFDLNPHLSKSNKKKKKNRPPPPSGFALSRYSIMKKKNRPPRPSLSRFINHLTLGRFRRHLRLLRRHRPPLIPKPLPARREGDFPCTLSQCVAVLGSKLYIIGGPIPVGETLHRGVYTIDASSDSPEMVKLSSELNFGKSVPIVCTIGGKIYALPQSFSLSSTSTSTFGRGFECFDPESSSWTVLPYPREAITGDSSRFEKLGIENLNCTRTDGFLVLSHTVVGSNLVISLARRGGVYTFDTTRPDRGWRRIILRLVTENGTPHLLNFLPVDHLTAFPIRDDLIFCPPRDDTPNLELNPHIRRSFKMDITIMDPYVCSFHNVAELSDPKCEVVEVSIHPVSGMEVEPKIKPEFEYEYEDDYGYEYELENREFSKSSRAVGDGIVLVSIDGNGNGSEEYSFEIFRVKRASNSDKDHRYEASKISSATFKTEGLFQWMIPFVIKG